MQDEKNISTTFTLFCGHKRIASGTRRDVTCAALPYAAGTHGILLAFSDEDGRQTELDLRAHADPSIPPHTAQMASGTAETDTAPPAKPGRGRPKLGVVAREVTLLPRHWQWLSEQPGGASVALRKLIDLARKQDDGGANRRRKDQEATYRFLTAMAGNLPDYEEVIRALFAADIATYASRMAHWPPDVRNYACQLATGKADSLIPPPEVTVPR